VGLGANWIVGLGCIEGVGWIVGLGCIEGLWSASGFFCSRGWRSRGWRFAISFPLNNFFWFSISLLSIYKLSFSF